MQRTFIILLTGLVGWIPMATGAEQETSVIGREVPDFELPDTDGKLRLLSDFKSHSHLVVVFLGTKCPIGNAYIPVLNELAERYAERGVGFVGINSNFADSKDAIAKHHQEFGIKFPMLIDSEQIVADLMSARRRPEAFLLDRNRQIQYRGRIDDRFGFTYKRANPRRADLAIAIDESLASNPISIPDIEPQGCLITRRDRLENKNEVTFKDVAPILNRRCAGCHHPGTAAPFSLLSYDDADAWSEMIHETVFSRRMPPWDADPRHGVFVNDLRMTQPEIDTVLAWIKNGKPKGEQVNDIEISKPEEGWMIGKPDVVLKMEEEYTVQANGVVEYKYFVTPTNFEQDMWVKAAEARPGNWNAVHHIIAYVRPAGSSRKRALPAVGGYAPGEEPMIYPEGVGFRVPAGSEIVWQLHYTPTGKVEKDQSELGLVFYDQPPAREARGGAALNVFFKIPAGEANHRVVSKKKFDKDVELISLMPHMHLRGKDFKYVAHLPDGTEKVLLNVPNYDFNWQHRYRLKEPLFLPKNTTLECIAHFDNSEFNSANPDPSKSVRWGDQTWEEMMIGFYSYVEPLPKE